MSVQMLLSNAVLGVTWLMLRFRSLNFKDSYLRMSLSIFMLPFLSSWCYFHIFLGYFSISQKCLLASVCLPICLQIRKRGLGEVGSYGLFLKWAQMYPIWALLQHVYWSSSLQLLLLGWSINEFWAITTNSLSKFLYLPCPPTHYIPPWRI